MSKVEDQKELDRQKDAIDKSLLQYALGAVVAVFLLAIVAVTIYAWNFSTFGLSNKTGAWGAFGDFLGGVINPAVGLVTVFLILITVVLQRRELRNTIEEMKNSNEALAAQNAAIAVQSFEQTFFSWLSSYREHVASIRLHITRTIPQNSSGLVSVTEEGREALHVLVKETLRNSTLREILKSCLSLQELESMMRHSFVQPESKDRIAQIIIGQWERSYWANEHHVDSMFRTLYRLIRWVDEQPDTFLAAKNKWQYISIIRAQLSRSEMVVLFFNGFTPRGAKFSKYINKYAIFDNLEDNDEVSIKFLKSMDSCPFSDAAFDSDVARRELGIQAEVAS